MRICFNRNEIQKNEQRVPESGERYRKTLISIDKT